MKVIKNVLFMMMLMAIASPLFAQGGGAVAAMPKDWKTVVAGFAMAIASGLCGLGQAKAIAACAEGMARNPGAGGQIRGALILGLAFIESLALFTLVIIFAV
jgi:F-type H+-transporting ATPase subunit c